MTAPNPGDSQGSAAGDNSAEQAEAEMRANYPHLKRAVYSLLREKFSSELPPLPDKKLEDVAKDEGALPLEEFIEELERTPERP
jgi:hypothetical protein